MIDSLIRLLVDGRVEKDPKLDRTILFHNSMELLGRGDQGVLGLEVLTDSSISSLRFVVLARLLKYNDKSTAPKSRNHETRGEMPRNISLHKQSSTVLEFSGI